MEFRPVSPQDADALSALLEALRQVGKRRSAADVVFVRERYIDHPNNIRTTLAVENGAVLGFQVLKLATDGNPYGVTPGWGIIGTHIHPDAARRGLGRALFERTLTAARSAGLQKIDATIGADNAEGLAYYSAMGFETYREADGAICKCYSLAPVANG